MTALRIILLFAIGLLPMTGLRAGGVVGLDEPANICCGDACACALSLACGCHEEPTRPAPIPPTTPAPERVPLERLFDHSSVASYEIEPIEQRYRFACFEDRDYRQGDLDNRLPVLCLWLI